MLDCYLGAHKVGQDSLTCFGEWRFVERWRFVQLPVDVCTIVFGGPLKWL